MKKLISIILGLLMMPIIASAQATAPQGGTGLTTYAAGDMIYAASLNPIRFTKLNIGSSGLCLTSNGSVPSWGSCGSGTFPFTVNANYNSTSTTIGFLNGLFSTASSTFSGPLRFTALSQGSLYVGSNSLVNTVSTSTPTVTAPITYSGTLGQFLGGVSGAFDCTTASASTKGCISAADYSKALSATTTFSLPLVYTLGTNAVTCPTCTIGGLTSYDAFTHPGVGISATTSQLNMAGFLSTASSTIVGNATTTGTFYAGVSTSSATFGSGLSNCTTGSSALVWSAATGQFGCNSISGGNGAPFPFDPHAGPYVSTSTLVSFQAGIIANASSTIGAGNQGTGLTIQGGATTTGISVTNGILSTASSTIVGSFQLPSLSDGCLNVTTGVVGSTGSACGSSGSTSVGPVNTLQASNGSGGFIATATPQLTVGNIIATTSASSYFQGKVGISSTSPSANLSIGPNGSNNLLEISVSNTVHNLVINQSGLLTFAPSLSGGNSTVVNYGNSVPSLDAGGIFFLIRPNVIAPGAAVFRVDANGNNYMTIDGNGFTGIATTSPQWLLNPFSSGASQLALSAGAGVNQWAFRNAGGNLYLSTTTVAGTATSSISALEISGSGFGTTTVRGLNIAAQATTTSNVGLNITSGCYAYQGSCISGGGGGGSGTVTNVATDATLTGGPITTTGTLGINLSNPNNWLGLQTFVNSSSTLFSSTFASTTRLNVGVLGLFGTTTDFSDSNGPHNFVVAGPDTKNIAAFENMNGTVQGAIYVDNTNAIPFQFGTISNKNFGFFTNNNSPQLTMYTNNSVGIGATFADLTTLPPTNGLIVQGMTGIGTTTTSVYGLTSSSSTAPQLGLSAGAGLAQWAFRNAGGNLYLSTSTVSGSATTSISALEIAGSGFGTTTVRGLNIVGQATTTSNVGLNITNGCVAYNGTCISGSGGGSGTVTSVGLALPTGFTITNSPVTSSGTLTGTLQTGYSIRQLPSIIVAAAGGDTTSIQTALTTCGTLGGGNIYLTDSNYSQGGTGLTFRSSNCHLIGRGSGTTTISFTGATTLFKTNSAAGLYENDSIEGITVTGDSNASGIAFDLSDMTHFMLQNTVTDGVGTWVRANDTQNITFYNKILNNTATTLISFGLNASSTNPWNGNIVSGNFLGCNANCISIQMNNANGNTITDNYPEPASVTGTVGIKIFDNTLSTNNGVFNNNIANNYIEANGIGISVASSVNPAGGGIQRNIFTNNTVEANTVDYSVTNTALALQTWVNNYDSNFNNPITSMQGPVGIATSTEMQSIGTTPYAFFGVNPIAGVAQNSFVIGSSTKTLMRIDNGGNLFLGTTTAGCLQVNTVGLVSSITCTGGGSGTVSTAPAGYLAYYNATGNTVVGTSTDPLYVDRIVATTTKLNVLPYASTTAISSSGQSTFNGIISNSSSTIAAELRAVNIGLGKAPNSGIRAEILTDGTFTQGVRVEGDVTTRLGFSAFVTGDAQVRYTQRVDGLMGWGSGAAVTDTDLYRNGIGQLRTDNTFLIGNYLGVGTTTPLFPYQATISSSTAPQLSLSADIGLPQWTLRNAGGNLYLSTTTVQGLATTSISALEISGSGFGTTTLRGLNISGQATSTSNVGYNITTGCYAIGGTCLSTSGGSGLTSYDAWTHWNTGYSATTSSIGIGTSTPRWQLQVASSTAPQLSLSDGSLTSQPWTFRNAGGNMYIATASPSTFATSSVPAMTIASTSYIGIGTAFPLSPLTVTKQSTYQSPMLGSLVQFVGLDSNPLRITFDTHNSGTSGTALMFRNSGGTAATPSATILNAVLGSLNFRGYGTTGYSAASTGVISAKSETAFTDTSMPTNLTFDTTPASSVTAVERMRITGAGLLGIGTTTPFAQLQVATTSANGGFKPQFALTDMSAGVSGKQWYMSNFGGIFEIGTTSDSGTYATSSALRIGPPTIGIAQYLFGTTTSPSNVHFSGGTNATTTVSFGEMGDTTSKSCFNAKTNTGTAVSFYFVGTTMVVESSFCK